MKKILITGISGSGGSYLAEHLIEKKKYFVYGLTRSKNKSKNLDKIKNNKKFKLYYCDLLDFKMIKKIIKKINPKIIFHLAADADVHKSFTKPYSVVSNNVNSTLNLLEALRVNNYKGRFIMCSTSEVYGNVPANKQPITEKNSFNPINPYAVSKTFQDQLSLNYKKIYNLDIIITRMFTYLNARRGNLFASSFARQIVNIETKKQKILNHGNLSSTRTILDIRDAMEAYRLAAEKGRSGGVYNISGNTSITVRNFLKKLINKSTTKIKTKEDKNLVRPVDIDLQISSSELFKKDTGWKEKFNLDESINYLLKETRGLLK
tara:strand:- start:231 stop:1190 length:960 start_codon:yes stop_codon:yes gene_type:complete